MVESKGTFAFIAFLLLLKCIGNRCSTCNISIHHVGVNNLFCGADLPAEKVTARSVEGVQAFPSFKVHLGFKPCPGQSLRGSSYLESPQNTALSFVLFFQLFLFLELCIEIQLYAIYILNAHLTLPAIQQDRCHHPRFTDEEIEDHRFRKCGLSHTTQGPWPEFKPQIPHLQSPQLNHHKYCLFPFSLPMKQTKHS